MAASNWKSSVVITKRVVARSSLFRRGVHATSYDKNPEDLVHDGEVTREARSDKYWAPHPKTGVFGPEGDNKMGLFGSDNSKESVLEEKAWFRPTSLEDLEKPI